jgi:inosine/xanthosine triphosphatase
MESKRCRVAVGSLNPVKVNAVKTVFKMLCEAEIISTSVPSGVPPQPIGLKEIIEGALNRALGAREKTSADYGVGIEAGAIITAVEPLELQAAIIVDSEDKVSIGLSQVFPLPRRWLGMIKKGVELGTIASEATKRKNIGKKLGLIGYLTHGLITRTDLTRNALIMALVPRLNPQLYPELPTVEEVRDKLSRENLIS